MTEEQMIELYKSKESYDTDDLLGIMKLLRTRCPWDKEQTHESIRMNFLEESYEVCEAIDTNSAENLCEELGDVLLQVVFHAQMSEEVGDFAYRDVVDGICKKLVYRHPHVFGEVEVSGTGEVLSNWDSLKEKEKHQTSVKKTLEDVPAALPALIRAQKLIKRAHKGGYEYSDLLADMQDAEAREYLSDKLFELCSAARAKGIDLEELLQEKNKAFVNDFE